MTNRNAEEQRNHRERRLERRRQRRRQRPERERRGRGQHAAPDRGGQQHSPQEIGDLLSRLIEELGRSNHPDRADLIQAAEDAREEVASPEPRKGTLRTFAKGLVSAVPGFTALAALAKTIEEAVRGL
ncbi:hypothetical protein [Streptomyces sioyaensis]|uniref:hypothetical protein n=1 Tax=Streptomyces sioyaensis TaxID=67364 RepID=UPI0037225381